MKYFLIENFDTEDSDFELEKALSASIKEHDEVYQIAEAIKKSLLR